MPNEYKDVLRAESTEAGLTGILRSGQLGFATDSHKMVRKFNNNEYFKWTPDESRTIGASGVFYTNTSYPSIANVADALNTTLSSNTGYFVDTGVTGIPHLGDGIVDTFLTQQGSAVYSEDGHVYFMGEQGLTGAATLAGCKFVINPIPIADPVKFVIDGGDASDYSSFGYTGTNAVNDAELHLRSNNGGGGTAHLLLQASYGKLKLTTGAAVSAENGITLTGYDGEGAQYNVAAAGKFRDLYTDENGGVVQGESDTAQRYKSAGFTAVISDSYMDVETFSYVDYSIQGDVVIAHFSDLQANSDGTGFIISGLPAEIQAPVGTESVLCQVYDFLNANNNVRPGRMYVPANGTAAFQTLQENVASGEQEFAGATFGVTGTKGWPQQTLMWRVNA